MDKIIAYIKQPRTLKGEYDKLYYIYNRLREPSTHAALVGLFAVFGRNITDEMWNNVMNGFTVVFAVLGVLLKESKEEE